MPSVGPKKVLIQIVKIRGQHTKIKEDQDFWSNWYTNWQKYAHSCTHTAWTPLCLGMCASICTMYVCCVCFVCFLAHLLPVCQFVIFHFPPTFIIANFFLLYLPTNQGTATHVTSQGRWTLFRILELNDTHNCLVLLWLTVSVTPPSLPPSEPGLSPSDQSNTFL